LLQVEAGIRFIERNPVLHPIEYNGTRKHLIKRFPYKIIYLIDKERIIILAVLQVRRNPDIIEKIAENIS